MEKTYVLLDWPDSQPFIGKKDCVATDDMQVFVPREKYLKSQGTDVLAKDLLTRSKAIKEELIEFIGKNVPESGTSVTKHEQFTGELRIDFCEHFTGEASRMTVTKIFPGRIEGVDDYGNVIEHCPIREDLSVDAIYDIARFLVYNRGRHRV